MSPDDLNSDARAYLAEMRKREQRKAERRQRWGPILLGALSGALIGLAVALVVIFG